MAQRAPDSAPLSEPLLQELPPSLHKRLGPNSVAPRAWHEFTHENGRGRAVLTAFLLGASLAGVVLMLVVLPSTAPFGLYFTLLVLFHMSEYLLTAAFRPDTLSFDNFLINHSAAYQAMVSLAWVEYWVEWYFFGALKMWGPLCVCGLLLCAMGLSARSVGMATAATNFSHKIEDRKRPEHTLTTHGIYSVLRHPAYFGFFWWSVGTQVLLLNPVCLLAYAAASWHFFYDRIPHEEALLVEFFGEEYRQYRRRTAVGIPLVEWAVRHFPP